MTSNKVTHLKGHTFEFLERGRGPAVLWLHGLFGEPANWAPTLERLAEGYRALALRFPFFSGEGLCTVSALTAYVTDFLDALGLERVSLGGNSLGGQVALSFCLEHPGRVEALVLTGSAGLWEAQPNGQLPKATRAFVRTQAERIFYDPKHVDEQLVDLIHEKLQSRAYVRTLLRLAKDTQRATLSESLSAIEVPTLLLWGRQDRITPPEVAQRFHRMLPRSTLVFLDRCGHAPPLERPHRFACQVKRFLDQTLRLAV